MKLGQGKLNLTEDPIGRSIYSLMWPMLVGMLAMMSYSIADIYFIGRLGTMELAAVAFTFPVNFIVGAMALGLGIGTSSVASRLFGAGERDEIQRITTHSLLLAVAAGLVIVLVGLSTIEPVFKLLGADDTTLPMIERYMRIYYLGGVFTVVPMIGSSVLRASGDAKTPMKIMAISAIFNIILDPILIFGLFGAPRLELEGAAIATVLANVGTATAAFSIIYFRDHLIRFRASQLRLISDSWKRILHVGIPSMTSSMVAPLTTAFITWQVAQFGQEAVAGFGVASRLEALSLLLLMSLSGAVTPFVGQNFGAGNYERVRDGVKFASRFSIIYGVTVAAFLFIASSFIIGLFTDDPGANAAASMHLHLVPWSYGFLGLSMTSVGAFNAIGKPMPAMLVSLSRTIGVYVPLAFILAHLLGLLGVFLAAFSANIIAGLFGYIWFRSLYRSFLAQERAVQQV